MDFFIEHCNQPYKMLLIKYYLKILLYYLTCDRKIGIYWYKILKTVFEY